MTQISQISSIGDRPHAKYEQLIARSKEVPAAKTVVVHPCDETSLRGATEAAEIGSIIMPILVGPAAKITAAAREHKIDIGGFTVVDVPHSEAAAARGVELVREGVAELLMKGPAHRRVDACRNIWVHRLAHGAADQPHLRHGRSHVRRSTAPHRCRHQHLSRSRCQARHHSERH